jgi:hypothetical protein
MKITDLLIRGVLLTAIAACLFAMCTRHGHAANLEIHSFTGFGSHGGVDYWQESLEVKGTEYIYGNIYTGPMLDVTKYTYGWRAGASWMLGYDFAKFWGMTFYSEAGSGIAVKSAYREWERRHHNIIGTGLCGVIKGGIGLRFDLTKKTEGVIGFGYDHLSSFRSGDKGLNALGGVVGVRW